MLAGHDRTNFRAARRFGFCFDEKQKITLLTSVSQTLKNNGVYT